jgi:hypothetical protein
VFGGDVQVPEAAVAYALGEIVGFGELADRLFDRHFPDRRGADVDVWFMVQPVLDVGGEAGVVR